MEVALIGALASIGWWINKKQPTAIDDDHTRIQPVVDHDDKPSIRDSDRVYTDNLDLFNTEAIQNFKDSHFPERTGVIAPFYKSMGTQNTNDEVKQRKLDAFTGSDPTWQHKREKESFFEVKPQAIDSSGRQGNTPYRVDPDQLKNALTDTQHNALPFTQKRVGPGIGVGVDTPAADGFHPMLRAIPVNGLAHKNSEMPGRVNAGHVLNANRPVDPTSKYTKPARVWDMSRRPLVQGRAAATAPAHRGKHSSVEPIQCHVDGDHYVGTAYRKGGYDTLAEMTRQGDRSESTDTLNLKGPTTGGLAYTKTAFDEYRMNSQNREAPGEFRGVKYHNSAIQAYPQSAPQETERDIVASRPGGPGRVAPVVRKEYMRCSDMQLLKESKRSGYDQTTYIPGPQRTDALLLAKLGYKNSPYLQQYHTFRSQNKRLENRRLGHAQSSYVYNHSTHVGEDASHGKKISGENNPRLDFSIAKNALQGNPYAIHQQ
jgi:hypothetical protein